MAIPVLLLVQSVERADQREFASCRLHVLYFLTMYTSQINNCLYTPKNSFPPLPAVAADALVVCTRAQSYLSVTLISGSHTFTIAWLTMGCTTGESCEFPCGIIENP